LAALLQPALHAHIAAHDLGELAHNGETQARSAEAPVVAPSAWVKLSKMDFWLR